MTRAATYPEVTPFGSGIASLGGLGRAVVSHVVAGIGAVVAVCAAGAIVTVAAAWIVAAALSTHSSLRASAPIGLQTVALANPHRARIDTAGLAAAYALELTRDA